MHFVFLVESVRFHRYTSRDLCLHRLHLTQLGRAFQAHGGFLKHFEIAVIYAVLTRPKGDFDPLARAESHQKHE